MTRGRNREERIAACAAIHDPQARQCWHLRCINKLLNKLAKRVSEVNRLDAQLRFAQEKIDAQKIALARMSIQAETHNKEIRRLSGKLDTGDHTPTPQFERW